jgi:hypothetical protein
MQQKLLFKNTKLCDVFAKDKSKEGREKKGGKSTKHASDAKSKRSLHSNGPPRRSDPCGGTLAGRALVSFGWPRISQ